MKPYQTDMVNNPSGWESDIYDKWLDVNDPRIPQERRDVYLRNFGIREGVLMTGQIYIPRPSEHDDKDRE